MSKVQIGITVVNTQGINRDYCCQYTKVQIGRIMVSILVKIMVTSKDGSVSKFKDHLKNASHNYIVCF